MMTTPSYQQAKHLAVARECDVIEQRVNGKPDGVWYVPNGLACGACGSPQWIAVFERPTSLDVVHDQDAHRP
jgi:hypothetical protein